MMRFSCPNHPAFLEISSSQVVGNVIDSDDASSTFSLCHGHFASDSLALGCGGHGDCCSDEMGLVIDCSGIDDSTLSKGSPFHSLTTLRGSDEMHYICRRLNQWQRPLGTSADWHWSPSPT